ncbi:S4 domain-containing protein YaaA [Vagococcus xieshaowenii]|uniref:S4 domain-containing protein YaaA n=1 Tax=Vagococcus xieshaowenii TaxID=2562451 RepID=A0AAJ5EGT9_9ENTE|nr:S4 domain-containing protein YaaA [Vagococcus xieshaowenii]QCA27842.1 S4 domain-containing protein YaaA [Vagococcus xieshaowenii]TFZ42450.1 S4 domain-containing protein YaaA [Vagococcus xieshaowenii]
MKQKFLIDKEFITLGQFLKEVDEIPSGGMAKWYLQEHVVLVDGEVENRRGRKLRAGTMVELPDGGIFFMDQKPTGKTINQDELNETI